MKMKFFIIVIFIVLFVLSSQLAISMAQTPPSLNEKTLTEEKIPLTFSNDVNRQAQETNYLSCLDFQFTCEYRTPEEVQEAIKNGADINCQDEDLGWTPLMNAILNDESAQEIVTLLVEAGANVNQTDWEGMNALMLAADSSDETLVSYLLEHGAQSSINSTESKYGFTPLIWAAKNNETHGAAIIQALIDHGADIHIKDKNGMTAILYAATVNKSEEVIRTLIGNGADINQIGPKNLTPLMCAIGMNSNINITKILLDSGADVSVVSEEGKKAIDYALELERFKGTTILQQLADLSGVEISHPVVSPGVEITPSPTMEVTATPSLPALITPQITPIPTSTPTQVIPSMVYSDPSGKFTLHFPDGFSFSTYVAEDGIIGANYRTPNERAHLEIRSFPSSQDLQFYLSQQIGEMALRGESSITANGKSGSIKVYSRKTETDELLSIVATYQGIDISLVVIDLPISAYQSSSQWLLELFKGINWQGKTPIIDDSYFDPDQKFFFKLPDGVHFLYAFKEDFYFNQPFRFLPEANGMIGNTPDNGKVLIANFSTSEKYQDYLKKYDQRVENGEYQVHGTSKFDVQGRPVKLTLYSYLSQNQKRAELLAVYEGTMVVVSVWLPADNYQAAQTWLLSVFKSLTWKKEETLPSFSPTVQLTPSPQITTTPQPTELAQPTASPQMNSNNLSSEAAIHIEKGEFQKAIPLLKEALSIQPDFGFAYGQLAYCYIQLKLYQEAIDEISNKLLPKKEYSTAYNLVGFAYENLARLDEALVAYKKAVELDPYYVDAYSNMGFVYFDQEQYQKAMDAFKKAFELKPNDPVIINNLGFSYEKLGQYDEALKAYQEAIRIKPDYLKAYVNLGYLYFDQEQYQKAMDAFKKSIELESNDPAVINTLGVSYEKLGQYDEALKAYQEAIRIKPDYITAHNNLGNLFFDLGQYQNALQIYKKSLVLDASNPYNYYNLGLCYENLQQYDDAILAYQEAISLKPDYANAYTNLGIIYYNQNQTQKAIEAYKKSLELKPDNPNVHYNLALAYEDLEQFENALKAFQEANRIQPDSDTYNSLGRVYNSLEKYQEAIEALQKSIELNPENHYAYYNLGFSYEGLKQYENAIKSYQEAIRIKPDYIYAYNDLGYVYYYIDRNEEAVEILQKAININPKAAIPHYYLGLTYLQMGNKALVTKQYELLKSIDQSLAEKLLKKMNQ